MNFIAKKNFIFEKLSKFDYIILGITFLSLASQVSFNIGLVPITTQTLGVYFLGLWMKPKESFNIGVSWLTLGLMGFPAFAPGFVSLFTCPSFGYILGMVIGMPLMKLVFNKYNSPILACITCYIIVHLLGCIWLYNFVNSISETFWIGVYPFILVEIFKIATASTTFRLLEQKYLHY